MKNTMEIIKSIANTAKTLGHDIKLPFTKAIYTEQYINGINAFLQHLCYLLGLNEQYKILYKQLCDGQNIFIDCSTLRLFTSTQKTLWNSVMILPYEEMSVNDINTRVEYLLQQSIFQKPIYKREPYLVCYHQMLQDFKDKHIDQLNKHEEGSRLVYHNMYYHK